MAFQQLDLQALPNLDQQASEDLPSQAIPQIRLNLGFSSNASTSTEASSPLIRLSPRKHARKSQYSEVKVSRRNSPSPSHFGSDLLVLEKSESNVLMLPLDLSPRDIGSSSCGEESPLKQKLRRIPLVETDYEKLEDFSELYTKVEAFLDHVDLSICDPADRRRAFDLHKLQISTILSKSYSVASEKTPQSNCSTPGWISPSINTSSLFKRRSDSTGPRGSLPTSTHKSPFYNYKKEEAEVVKKSDVNINMNNVFEYREEENPADEKFSPSRRRRLHSRFLDIPMTISRNCSEAEAEWECSSAGSKKMGDCSPMLHAQ